MVGSERTLQRQTIFGTLLRVRTHRLQPFQIFVHSVFPFAYNASGKTFRTFCVTFLSVFFFRAVFNETRTLDPTRPVTFVTMFKAWSDKVVRMYFLSHLPLIVILFNFKQVLLPIQLSNIRARENLTREH